MKVTSSYQVKLHNVNHALDETVKLYRKVVKFLIPVIVTHYDSIKDLSNNEAMMFVERLIHSTKSRKALYPSFDRNFYKYPGYYRRSAISSAIAHVKSNMELRKIQSDSFLDYNPDSFPIFFKGGCFKHLHDNIYAIKVFKDNDWKWFSVRLDKSNLRYLHTYTDFEKLSAPVLTRRYHGWSLRFVYEHEVSVKYVKDSDVDIAVGVDLGLNTDATCSAVGKNGTVYGQCFINCLQQKDRLYHLLNKIKKLQQNGNRKPERLWSYVRNYNRDIAIRVSHEIVSFAVNSGAKVIVFENLGNLKPRGPKRQKIALWRKRDIQKRTEHLAKRFGIRISYICAFNTSRLAFDGSGVVMRGRAAGYVNNKLCRFPNGKVYNCDLSASKNIVARYFLRVMRKSTDEKKWSEVMAKVPELSARTRTTLSTLINLHAVMGNQISYELSDDCTGREPSHVA